MARRATGARDGCHQLVPPALQLGILTPMEAEDATILMNAAAQGDHCAADRLLPLVYDQLRRAAQQRMAGEGGRHTLSATALVHEAYLNLAGPRQVAWAGRAHYYAAAAEAMRRILIDHARAKAAGIRGGPEARRAAVSLAALPDPSSETESCGFLILNDAIVRLEGVDPKAAAVVRLRYFAGLSIEQTASALGVSTPTVKRTWAFARGWLKEAIESERV
ncbi:MAG: sigma-70 family RNA polymerase sigma factor [Phycisphaeraceae bacterium]|nr:sigma-70 family RNA polymerase sigma factor [Phycisphaeraceae bacterium]